MQLKPDLSEKEGKIPILHWVTYHYYSGRIQMAQENFFEAEESRPLTNSNDHCPLRPPPDAIATSPTVARFGVSSWPAAARSLCRTASMQHWTVQSGLPSHVQQRPQCGIDVPKPNRPGGSSAD